MHDDDEDQDNHEGQNDVMVDGRFNGGVSGDFKASEFPPSDTRKHLATEEMYGADTQTFSLSL